jgi:hypothetical protein
MTKVKILLVSANPPGTSSLRLDEEVHQIEAKIQAATHRDGIDIIAKWATRPLDLLEHLNRHEPQIVQFSGHGSPAEEIILVSEQGKPKPVSKDALVALFCNLKNTVRLVILNACFSRPQAKAITREIDCAIGMSRAIGDESAITFASAFYSALGFGKSIGEAFRQGKAALLLQGIPEERTPILMTKKGVDADSLVLVNP